MNNTIFSTASESFPIAHIVYAGYITEIPVEKRKGDQTHYFKIITTTGPAYCYFDNLESVKKARNLLGAMMSQQKRAVFKSGNELIDASSIVSFSKIITLKKVENGFTHAMFITLNALIADKAAQVWMHYKSEESARNARKALFATIFSLYEKNAATETEPELISTESHAE